jgi:hypothetical protein
VTGTSAGGGEKPATPFARLKQLTTADLVGEYGRLMTNRHNYANGSNPAQRQKRINRVVDLISERADDGDSAALTWLDNATPTNPATT